MYSKIRALKDPEFRASLDGAEQVALKHPEGLQEIEDAVLNSISGGCCPPESPWATTRVCSCTTPNSQCP